MKKLILIFILCVSTLCMADPIKFYILPEARSTHEAKLKAMTREIWGDDTNIQLPRNWSEMPEEGIGGKIEWCYSGWTTNQVCAELSTTNADLYCVTQAQIDYFMTSNKWNQVRNDLKPMKYGQDYWIDTQ